LVNIPSGGPFNDLTAVRFQKILHEKEKEVKAAESDVQEQQTRLDAQRAIEFYDELESDKV
jgi:hypothetical protein